jgi:hypothetical protein
MKKRKKDPWFRSVRRSYLPRTWQGLVIYFAFVAYLVAVPVIWYNTGHDAWTLVTTVIPLWAFATLVTQYVASKNSK